MQCANRDRTVCPSSATMFAIFVLRASAQMEAVPKSGHARRRSGASDLCKSRVKEGPIGKQSALLVLEHVHRQMKILVLNSGSSNQKACLYEIGDALPESAPLPLWEGRIEWNGDTAAITVRNSKGMVRKKKLKSLSCELVLKDLLATLWR